MTIQTYLDNRMVKVGSELADVDLDLTGCIQPADWTEFSARASKKLDKAYAAFCSSIYWGIVRGACGGLRSFGMAEASASHIKLHGNFGMLAVVPGNTEAPNLLRMRPSPNGLYDYTNIALAPDRDRKVQAYLSLDLYGVSQASICYGTWVKSPRKLQALKPKTNRQVVIAPMVDRALLAQDKSLQLLLSQFERIGSRSCRRRSGSAPRRRARPRRRDTGWTRRRACCPPHRNPASM